MNVHAPITADPAADDRAAFLSLAQYLRARSHEQRAWAKADAAAGKPVSAYRSTQEAKRLIADAIWYLRKARSA